MVKETIKRRLRYVAASSLILFIIPLCKRDRTVSGASSHNAFAGETVVCAIDLGDDMYGSHGLETGFNYELLERFAKDNRCDILIKAGPKDISWLDSLKAGSVDMVVTHAHEISDKSGILLSRQVDECSVWAVNENEEDRIRYMNRWISHITSGPDFNRMKDRYTGDFNPHRRMERGIITGSISPYDGIIRKYAGQLGWDWRMLAAVIFQESRFSINSTSFRGASGLMQVMPSTASYYGVTDLLNPQQNILAGASHLKRLQNLWKKEGLEGTELIRFTLASYNAGEGKIAECRAFAAENGRDCNNWDEIVSVIPMMRELGKFQGHETIAYIDNIFGHYEAICSICPFN